MWLALILALALAIRSWLALTHPAILHSDQIFQATEQAHRLIFGYGVVPWEFRVGARNWLLPGAIAGIMAPAAWLWPQPQNYLAAISVAFGALSLLGIWAAWQIGRRISLTHAVLAAFTLAVWVELALFADATLTEPVATNFLLLAIALLPGDGGTRRTFWGGVALGTAFVLRFHLAPALAVIAIAGAGRDARRWQILIAGSAIPLAMLGVADTIAWGIPFKSIYTSVVVNLFAGRANIYDVSGPFWYLQALASRWGILLVVFAALIGIGMRCSPLLLATAAIIVATHSLIPHKEYRFVVPAVACLVVLIGLGIGELVIAVRARLGDRLAPLTTALALLIPAAASIAVARSDPVRAELGLGRNEVEAFAYLRATPDLCGVAASQYDWYRILGHSGLHRPDVHLFLWEGLVADGHQMAANAMLDGNAAPPSADFTETHCFADPVDAFPPVCVHLRHGPCMEAPDDTINRGLEAIDG